MTGARSRADKLHAECRQRIAALETEVEALETEVEEDQAEHSRLIEYVKRIKPDAHSIYEVIDQLKARCAQAERERDEERAALIRVVKECGLAHWKGSCPRCDVLHVIVAQAAIDAARRAKL